MLLIWVLQICSVPQLKTVVQLLANMESSQLSSLSRTHVLEKVRIYDDRFVVDLVVNIRLMIATEEHGFVGWSHDSTIFVVHLNIMFTIMKTFICQRRKKGHFFYKKLVCEVNFNDESFSFVFTYQEHEPGNQSQGTD
jgi:hypothetical protein